LYYYATCLVTIYQRTLEKLLKGSLLERFTDLPVTPYRQKRVQR